MSKRVIIDFHSSIGIWIRGVGTSAETARAQAEELALRYAAKKGVSIEILEPARIFE